MAILAPLLLLAGLGIRGLQANQQAALDEARRRSERGLDQAWPAVRTAWDDLGRSTPLLRLYPVPPVPAPQTEASRLYADALNSFRSPDRAVAELTRLEADYPEEFAPSGVPLAPLAEWNCLRLEHDPAGLVTRAMNLRTAAVRQHPSVLTSRLLTAAVELLRGRGVDPSPLASWQTEWDQDERTRVVWRQHVSENRLDGSVSLGKGPRRPSVVGAAERQ